MSKSLRLPTAVRFVNKNGALLVFPEAGRKEPRSLWAEFFPRTKMRWEWDDNGDGRVGELWMLRERLSTSNQVIYSKWYRGRATLMSFEVFAAILRLTNPSLPTASGLTSIAREILDLLEEDSPVSTKQLKKMTELRGRSLEATYQKALKELWMRGLIVVYGEVDEGAFPSLAIGSTRVLFEDVWQKACAMSTAQAEKIILENLGEDSLFTKYLRSILKVGAKPSNTTVEPGVTSW